MEACVRDLGVALERAKRVLELHALNEQVVLGMELIGIQSEKSSRPCGFVSLTKSVDSLTQTAVH